MALSYDFKPPAPHSGGPSPDPEITDAPGRELWIGSAVAGMFFVLFLGWAALAPLDAGAYAHGQVVVSGSRQAVQHREGGVVSAIHVKEGDEVAQGQVLIEINASELRATERALSSQVLALQAQRARLLAERDRLSTLRPPAEFAGLPAEDRALADEAMRLQQLQFDARRRSLQAQRGVLSQRVSQLDQQIEGYNRQIGSNREQQRLIEEELTGLKSLAERGYAPQTRVRAVERTAAALEGDYGAYRAEVAKSHEAIGETRMEIVSLDRRMIEDVADQLRQTEDRLNEVAPRLTAARDQLGRAQVRAPASGEVVGLSAHTVGGVVQPGQTLMEIVPKAAPLVIEAQVQPNDADDLHVGQATEVRFSAFHERDLPIVHGRLTRLSADSFVDERTGLRFFRAEVSVPPQEMAALRQVRGVEAVLKPGLPAEVVVPLRKRTALDYFLEPLQQSLWRSFREH
ncbi:HlyD family type I secretion periplasmic adaptor subunit [Caulobacter sp. 17J80-11]|uniref:HlyD family type I secretion periplasmic adaptor subunit n=1 Tax=Caulobacter sp. 17J80-11 TaxID=2763502 RepID=UPI001653C816|nr:HlyD family type I secretion periplasmic adaptor subunit [Caulobacter sp. 17J80-11]MBC6981681.1 HlyD family type I secretion periplasmic adaptor subunit [Caulobacter sp. 17J80-11]